MSRKRIKTVEMQISSSSINVRVEVKSNSTIKVAHNVTFITHNNLPGKCYFTWEFKGDK